jgi:hypothetical protein
VRRVHADPHANPDAHAHADAVGDCHAHQHLDADADADAHRNTNPGPTGLLSGIERLRPAERRAVCGGKYGGLRRLLQRGERPVRCVYADAHADPNHHRDVHEHGDADNHAHTDPHADADSGSARLLSDAKRLWSAEQRAMCRRRRAGV